MSKLNFENFFLTALGDGKDDYMLKYYLQNNINLVHYSDSTQSRIMDMADFILAFIPKDKRREIVGDTSSARILKLLETGRPKLYKTLIQHPRGVVWLQEQIKNFEKRFL